MHFLTTTCSYTSGETILLLGNTPADSTNPGRIQVDELEFILPPTNIYHSCTPNAYIDWGSLRLKARISIHDRTLVTYHYGTSEDDYRIGAFSCSCGSPDCVKYFQGCRYLTQMQRDNIKKFLSPFLLKKYYPQ